MSGIVPAPGVDGLAAPGADSESSPEPAARRRNRPQATGRQPQGTAPQGTGNTPLPKTNAYIFTHGLFSRTPIFSNDEEMIQYSCNQPGCDYKSTVPREITSTGNFLKHYRRKHRNIPINLPSKRSGDEMAPQSSPQTPRRKHRKVVPDSAAPNSEQSVRAAPPPPAVQAPQNAGMSPNKEALKRLLQQGIEILERNDEGAETRALREALAASELRLQGLHQDLGQLWSENKSLKAGKEKAELGARKLETELRQMEAQLKEETERRMRAEVGLGDWSGVREFVM